MKRAFRTVALASGLPEIRHKKSPASLQGSFSQLKSWLIVQFSCFEFGKFWAIKNPAKSEV
jgi:hypothetical protein